MSKEMTAKIKSDILKIGWYQIIGGSIGVLIIFYSLLTATQLLTLTISIYFLMLLFFAYSVFCGTLCLQYKSIGLKCSLINQFLQSISFACLGYAFSYVAGLYLSVGLDLSNSIDVTFNVGVSKFDLNINNEHSRTEINFNLIAFGFIYWIDKVSKQLKKELKSISSSS